MSTIGRRFNRMQQSNGNGPKVLDLYDLPGIKRSRTIINSLQSATNDRVPNQIQRNDFAATIPDSRLPYLTLTFDQEFNS